MLEEIKTEEAHYFVDERGYIHGEYIGWYSRKWYHRLFRMKRVVRSCAFYDDSKLHGECTLWHNNGAILCHLVYVDGVKQGEYKSWWQNGQIQEHCFYVDDQFHGEYRLWYKDGTLVSHCFYINNMEVSLTEIPYPETEEDRMLFKLKYDLSLLSEETEC